MLKLIERFINKIKGRNDYRFEKDISVSNLIAIIYFRFLQVLRGFIAKLFFLKSKGILFLGRNVTIDFKSSFSSGRNLILEDRVYINALSSDGVNFGNNCTVGRETIIVCTGVIRNLGTGVSVGSNSAIGARNFISGQGGIKIGSDVIMGPDIRIFSENHNFVDNSNIIKNQSESRSGVSIGNNCWIGTNVTILDGVNIGDNCVIAAGSVVTKSCANNILLAGSPATKLKDI